MHQIKNKHHIKKTFDSYNIGNVSKIVIGE